MTRGAGVRGGTKRQRRTAAGFGAAAQVLRHPLTGGILIATAATR